MSTGTIVLREVAQAVITGTLSEEWVEVRVPCHHRRITDWSPADGGTVLRLSCPKCGQVWVLTLKVE